MAWVDVPGSNGIWEYENTAIITNTYLDSADGANSVISNGIRTWTRPGTSETLQCYIRCRTKIDSVERGELFKGYYDQSLSSGGGIETITNVVSDAATTLQSWFDGADNNEFVPNGPSEGDTFTQWTDKSNFAHNANSTGGSTTRPTFRTGVLNGKSVVRFDGSNDCLSINPVAWSQSLSGMTIIVVSKYSNTTGTQTLTTTDQDDMGLFIDTNFKVSMAGASADSSTSADTSFHIHTLKFDGSQSGNAARLVYRIDGSAETLTFTGTVGTTTSASNGTIFLGCDDSAEFLNGDVAEFLMFNKALTNTEITDVESYLTTKWGL